MPTKRNRAPSRARLAAITLALAGCAIGPAQAAGPGLSSFDAGLENKLGLTFSSDGKTAFWVEWDGEWGASERGQRRIFTALQQQGRWSEPRPAQFTGDYSDDDPNVSPDGRWLYFISDRPVDADDEPDRNIWRYSLLNDDRPEYVPVNSGAAEYSPVTTSSGALYFASDRAGGLGRGDIYRATLTDGRWDPPERMGPVINSPTGEWNLWVSPDEVDMVFEASSRSTNVSVPGDLYYTWRTPTGWTAAVALDAVNSRGSDLMPRLHPDGETLIYTTAPIGGHARVVTADWKQLKATAKAAYAPELLVANRASHDVAFVDWSRGEVVARVATGQGPHLLSNVSERRVAATGYGVFPEPHEQPVSSRPPFVEALNARLTVIDLASRRSVLDVVVDDCGKPHASRIVADRVYVTCETEGALLVADLDTGRTVDRFATRQLGSHVVGFHDGTGQLAVSNTDSGSLTLLNAGTGASRIVRLAPGSEGQAVYGDRIWVGNAIDGSVSVVDPATATEVATVSSVCRFPIAIDVTADNGVWVACFLSSELVSIDDDTLAVARRIALAHRPLNLALHPDRPLAYVSLPRRNAVAEIDLVSGEELRRVRVGIEPDGLRWSTK